MGESVGRGERVEEDVGVGFVVAVGGDEVSARAKRYIYIMQ